MDQACLMEDIFNSKAPSFACDQNTCIKNQAQAIQSQAEVSRGLRLRMISSRSAAKSASMTGLYPSSLDRASASAIDSEIVRRGGAAPRKTATAVGPSSMTTSAPALTRASREVKSRAASSTE